MRLVASAGDGVRGLERAIEGLEAWPDAPEVRELRGALLGIVTDTSARLAIACAQLESRDVERPFRIVLMGRTMAGKSTLFEYLTGGDGARIGEGAQRTTRDVCLGTVEDLGFELVDTPGVGAMDGQEDYAMAFSQVADADLILWVATNEATHEQTGRALERLSDLGKPILLALNCLHDVNDEIGLMDMLEEPDLIFGGDARGNLAPIERYLARAGGHYLRAVSIHAQAARLSVSGHLPADQSHALHENCRIDILLTEIRDQKERTAELRRVVSMGDFLRGELLEAAAATANAIAIVRFTLAATRGSQNDFRKRAERRVSDAHAELMAAFVKAVSIRERWIERIDVDLSDRRINAEWEREIGELRAEIKQQADDVGRRLETGLKQIALDVADDWAQIDVGGFQELGGRGAIWGNRLVKVGGRFAAGFGTAALGAKVGALAGTALGPGLGTAIGLGLGATLGLIVGLLGIGRGIDWVGDRVFRSPVQIRERRRQKVRDQLSPLLAEIDEKLFLAGEKLRQVWQCAVADELSRQSLSTEAIERASEALERALSLRLEPVLVRIDTEIAREVLRIMGRGRAAAAITRATRWRGAGMAVELSEPEFSELVLFPVGHDVERVLPTTVQAKPLASALQLVRSLTDRLVHTGVRLQVSETIEGEKP